MVWYKDRLLPPANVVCEGYVFTGVCLSTGGGGSPIKETPSGRRHPPGRETPHPPAGRPPVGRPPDRETPWQGEHPKQRDPPGRRHPPAGRPPTPQQGDPPVGRPLGRENPLAGRTPPAGRPPQEGGTPQQGDPPGRETPRQGDPPGRETPSPSRETPRRLLLRAVRILLECILVKLYFTVCIFLLISTELKIIFTQYPEGIWVNKDFFRGKLEFSRHTSAWIYIHNLPSAYGIESTNDAAYNNVRFCFWLLQI